jgi:hypothetical protein
MRDFHSPFLAGINLFPGEMADWDSRMPLLAIGSRTGIHPDQPGEAEKSRGFYFARRISWRCSN